MKRDIYRRSRRRFDRDAEPGNWGSARNDYGEYAYGRFGRGDSEDRRRSLDERTYENRDLNFYLHNPSAYPKGMMPYGFRFEDEDDEDRHEEYRERPETPRNTPLREIMTRDVATVYPSDSVQYAARLMRDEDCGAVPVVNYKDQLIGMITDRDITVRLIASGYEASRAVVANCMTREAFACHISDTVRDCMAVMSKHQIRRLPIVDDRDRVIGIVSQADLARFADRSRSRRRKHKFTDMLEDISEPASDAYIS